jgi:uncharacterized tellurite resistance protein B-like protein
MRHYPINSKKAMARIVALAIIADGGLDKSELDALANSHILEHLRLSETEFDEIMHELCEDMLQSFDGINHGSITLYDDVVNNLLNEIQDPTLQRILLKVIISVVDADGRVTEGEAILVDKALSFWGINLWELVEEPHVRVRGYIKHQFTIQEHA